VAGLLHEGGGTAVCDFDTLAMLPRLRIFAAFCAAHFRRGREVLCYSQTLATYGEYIDVSIYIATHSP